MNGKYVVLTNDDYVADEGGENVQLRRGVDNGGSGGGGGGGAGRRCDEWLYRRPLGPTDLRHSREYSHKHVHIYNLGPHDTSITLIIIQQHDVYLCRTVLPDIDVSACDSGLDTPPSTNQRPASCRDISFYQQHVRAAARDSTDTGVSSSRGTLLVSPGGSFRANNNMTQTTQTAQTVQTSQTTQTPGSGSSTSAR